MFCRQLFVVFIVLLYLSGCASNIPPSYFDYDRRNDYPVGIVPARFDTHVETDYLLEGKGEGAAMGAGGGVAACGQAAAGSGEFGALAFLICLPFGLVIGGVSGAVAAESAGTVEANKQILQAEIARFSSQTVLSQKIANYLHQHQAQNSIFMPEVLPGPDSPDDVPQYTLPAAKQVKRLLEARMLDIRFVSTGKRGAPACLQMTAAARNIDTATNRVLGEMRYTHSGPCMSAQDWVDDDGKDILTEAANGYQVLAENIVDEFFFVYYPTASKPKEGENTEVHSYKNAPRYVLAPIHPVTSGELPNVFNVVFGTGGKKAIRAAGHLGPIPEVSSLSPDFAWEAFPRDIDLANENNHFADVSYDVRFYEGTIGRLPGPSSSKVVFPFRHLHTRSGLQEPRYQYEGELQSCAWYFWTVRAHFKLNGTPRVTEWSGYYGEHGSMITSPPYYNRRAEESVLFPKSQNHFSYLSFRTPASADNPDCWEKTSHDHKAEADSP